MKKGPLAEAQVVQCLREHGWPYTERRVQGGQHDRGDVAGIPGVVIEIKNQASMQLALWVDEASAEAAHAAVTVNEIHGPGGVRVFDPPQIVVPPPDLAVVWHKRRGKGDPLDWYVTMTGRDFLTLLTEYTRED